MDLNTSSIDFCCSASMPKSQHLPSFTALENIDCHLLLAFYSMSQIVFLKCTFYTYETYVWYIYIVLFIKASHHTRNGKNLFLFSPFLHYR